MSCKVGHDPGLSVCLPCLGLARAPVGYAGEPLVPGTLAALGLQPEEGKEYVSTAGESFTAQAVDTPNCTERRVFGLLRGSRFGCPLEYFREHFKPAPSLAEHPLAQGLSNRPKASG